MSTTISGLVTVQFTGLTGAGDISLPGLKAGDLVLGCYVYPHGSYTGYLPPQAYFEPIITADDNLHQTSSDWSAETFVMVLYRYIP